MELEQEIVKLKPWYQQVNFGDGIKSSGHTDCGDSVWPVIRKFMPKSLDGLRILDMGTNTGIHCVRAVLDGAEEAVGVDNNDAPMATRQQVFVKEFFEKKYKTELNITYFESEIEDFIFNYSGRKFDFILALSVLHHFRYSRHEEFIEKLGTMTDHVLVRFRAGAIDKNYKFFDDLFIKCGFNFSFFKEKESSPHLYLIHYTK